MRRLLALVWKTAREFSNDECSSMAAALAYYAIFALPGLLVLIIALLGIVMEPAEVRGLITDEMAAVIGPKAADQVELMVENTALEGTGPLGALIGFLTVAFGATGIVMQLQSALNAAWEVQPDPQRGGVRAFLLKRLFSFAMILAIGFLLLISLVISAVFTALGRTAEQYLPGDFSAPLLLGLNFTASFVVIWLLFSVMYRYLPDAEIRWRDVWIGSLVTSCLFTIGKILIGWYLGSKDVGSVFGAAGSLVLVLLWIYYSSLIVLFGAEFTQVWATRSGDTIRPAEGAVRVVKTRQAVNA